MIDKRLRRLTKQVRDKRRRFVREFNAEVSKRHRGELSCSSCADPWCCYQIVMAGLFEGVVIADHLLRTRQGGLFHKAAAQGTEQLGLYPEGYRVDDPEVNERVSSEWFDRREPCAFLRGGRCSIYQQRPIACSCYWTVSPAEQCAPPSGTIVAAVNHSVAMAWGISADAVFSRAVMGTGGGTLVAQLPLGYAVRLGFRLLTEGPEALHREDR